MAQPSLAATGVAMKRRQKGMTCRALSLAAELSESYVYKIETGEIAEMSLWAFARLAVALELSEMEIVALVLAEANARPEVLASRLAPPVSVTPPCQSGEPA